MTIKLYNTKTKSKEIFEPLDAENVRMYVCGPTVYDRAHLGNARPVVVFDTLFRLLRHTYGANHVTYVRNFTDVDDKINAKAAETGRSIADITEETIGWYHEDMDALGALRPTEEPRATAFIPQMIVMIETLIERGHAYPDGSGHVLFDVRSYDEYGALARRSLDDMRAGARVEIADNKRDPMDFVLWKPSTKDQPGWDSPWGNGRPGWHIECSAMADKLLWDEPKANGRLSQNALDHPHTFDIHGGGIDLQFPHHENEIAQSCCANKNSNGEYADFANVWMHNEMLQVEGKKMSKSLGNFFTVRDLLEQGVPGEVIRFAFLMTHYSSPMDWTDRRRTEAETRVEALTQVLTLALEQKVGPSGRFVDLPEGVKLTLNEDLNTSGAISSLESQGALLLNLTSKDAIPVDDSMATVLKEESIKFLTGLEVLGLYDLLLRRRARRLGSRELLDKLHLDFVVCYEHAKQTKDFSSVDERKALLSDAGVDVRISKEGVDLVPGPEFDAQKLENLI